LHLRHLGDEKKLSLVAELPTLWHYYRLSVHQWPEKKLQPSPGQRRLATASRVQAMFLHRRLHLSRALIKKMRTSTA
jgi:hypothetical protein